MSSAKAPYIIRTYTVKRRSAFRASRVKQDTPFATLEQAQAARAQIALPTPSPFTLEAAEVMELHNNRYRSTER